MRKFKFELVQLVVLATAAVINLGETQIEGEIRRPNLQWIDGGKPSQEMLVKLKRQDFENSEKEILAQKSEQRDPKNARH